MNLKREIYEVHIAYVNDAGYHAADPTLNGVQYPRIVDSRNNDNDDAKTLKKAYGLLGVAESFLSGRDDQVGYCYIIRVSDGLQIEKRKFGKLADIVIPDPEPEPEPEPTPDDGGESEPEPEPTPDPDANPDEGDEPENGGE